MRSPAHCNSTTSSVHICLAWPAPPPRLTPQRGRKPAAGRVRESVQRVLDNMYVPAMVYNAQQDLIASNLLGRAMFSELFEADRI